MLFWVGVCALCFTSACRKPQVTPEVLTIQEARVRTASLSASEAKEYERGFQNGSKMIQLALQKGLVPFLPRTTTAQGQFSDENKVRPEVEMDSETGLQIQGLFSTSDGYAKGQNEGFQWALQHFGSTLRRAWKEPELPATWWTFWTGELISRGTTQVHVSMECGALYWSVMDSDGFPPQHCWREIPKEWRLRHVSVQGTDLWLNTESGALALDLNTGAIRQVRPMLPSPVLDERDIAKDLAPQDSVPEESENDRS